MYEFFHSVAKIRAGAAFSKKFLSVNVIFLRRWRRVLFFCLTLSGLCPTKTLFARSHS